MPSKCRIWSNIELKKFADRFRGKVLNVSGNRDEDKQGGFYRDYFRNADGYYLSNYGKGYRGKGGIKLNLEEKTNWQSQFNVVFNHTTLEHIYDVKNAFRILCDLTKDILILVVPYIQQKHIAPDKSYLDYWRFTDEVLKRMCKENKMEVLYLSVKKQTEDDIDRESYIFLIATKNLNKWKSYNWN